MIKCIRCNVNKPKNLFYYNVKQNKQTHKCIDCCRELARENYHKNKEKNKHKSKEYRLKNKKYFYEKQKEWASKNRDKCSDTQRKRLKIDPLFRFNNRIRTLIRNSFKNNSNKDLSANKKKPTKTDSILGCSVIYFCKHIEGLFKEGMSFENHGKWHLDHIIPLSTAKNEEDIIRLNHYTNFQPLWAIDNLRKSNKIINETFS